MTDKIEQRLKEIMADNKCAPYDYQNPVPALCKALRRANNIISECDPDTVFGWEMECAAILSGEEGT